MTPWQAWFAWYPVRLGQRRVWLRWIERRRITDPLENCWAYRQPGPKGDSLVAMAVMSDAMAALYEKRAREALPGKEQAEHAAAATTWREIAERGFRRAKTGE